MYPVSLDFKTLTVANFMRINEEKCIKNSYIIL